MQNTIHAFGARYSRANYNARGQALLPWFIFAEIVLYIAWILAFFSLVGI